MTITSIMEGLISKKKFSVEFEFPPNSYDSHENPGNFDSSETKKSMINRQKTLVLPFGEDNNVIQTKQEIFGPHLLFALCRLTGCYHFNDKGRCTIPNLMYSLIFNILLVSIYAYTFEDRVNQGVEHTKTKKLIEMSIGYVIVGGNAIFSVISCLVLYLYKNRFPPIMKNVKDFRFHLMNKFIAALLLTMFAATVHPQNQKWVQLPFDFVVFQHFLYISQYVALTNRWNRYMMTMIKFVARFDEKMMEGHAKIIRAHKSLNEIYGLPILFNVVLSFIITVENLFKFYCSLKAGNFDPRTIAPVLFYSVLIFWVAAVSDFTTKLANKFNTELFKVMDRNSKMRNDTTLRLYLLKKYTVDFTACGFFSVGYPFITSLIAAAVTYLVVLIQFTE